MKEGGSRAESDEGVRKKSGRVTPKSFDMVQYKTSLHAFGAFLVFQGQINFREGTACFEKMLKVFLLCLLFSIAVTKHQRRCKVVKMKKNLRLFSFATGLLNPHFRWRMK